MNLKSIYLLAILICVVIIFSISCSFFEAPDTPWGLTADYNETKDAVLLNWKDVNFALDYTVYRGSNENSLIEIHSTSHISYIDYNYNYYEPYYAVKAENNYGESDISKAVLSDVPDHDRYETDNSIQTASELVLSDDAQIQKHSIMPAGDVDYLKFYGDTIYTYTIKVPKSYSFPVCISLVDAYLNFLGNDCEGTRDYFAYISKWHPSEVGWYYIIINSKNEGSEGYYEIFIQREN